jgi:hypothetical protein
MLSQYATWPAKPIVPAVWVFMNTARPRLISQLPAGSLPVRESSRSIQKSVPPPAASAS